MKIKVLVIQLCLTLCDPRDYRLNASTKEKFFRKLSFIRELITWYFREAAVLSLHLIKGCLWPHQWKEKQLSGERRGHKESPGLLWCHPLGLSNHYQTDLKQPRYMMVACHQHTIESYWVLFLKMIYILVYFVFAALGLHCFARPFSGCSEWGCCLAELLGLPLAVASLVAECWL